MFMCLFAVRVYGNSFVVAVLDVDLLTPLPHLRYFFLIKETVVSKTFIFLESIAKCFDEQTFSYLPTLKPVQL